MLAHLLRHLKLGFSSFTFADESLARQLGTHGSEVFPPCSSQWQGSLSHLKAIQIIHIIAH